MIYIHHRAPSSSAGAREGGNRPQGLQEGLVVWVAVGETRRSARLSVSARSGLVPSWPRPEV